MKKILVFCCALTAICFTPPASAQVIVNGKRLSRAEIAQLSLYSCGPIYPGNYWLNMQTGYWGYAGSYEVVGHIRDRCGDGRRPSLSERGRLYSPGELLR